ncbi:branched-chain amino acid ABC transporter substrate-binding protein [Marinivivus vitaminiproducens]|uniref:branched-chain amino acid ABC transporter substrate-binding protein n=1 Tax=Marinivivus vitaminiproducens TaxID=3035935 RepID=UPI00279E366F|nr:branched-chain amino acid ABC transporter substrate-binding protein [Geminicoccaceae bacterium SCSIO 64248]
MSPTTSRLLGAAALLGLTAGAAQAEILIGTAGPITGQYAVFGEQMRRGAEMAVKDINAAGGVLGEELVLTVGDDACDARQAVAVANQMVNEGIVFMAGHFCSSSSIPASDVYNEEGILQITPGSTNPQLTERGYTNVFRTCGRDDQQGPTAARIIKERGLGQNIAIIDDKSAYGKGLADETRKALNAEGIQEAMNESITQGDRDFSALISRMKAENIDLVYLGGYHTEAGLITRQMRDQGMQARLMSGDAMLTNEYWSITGDAGEGTLFTFGPDPREFDFAQDIVKAFRDSGYEPEGYTLFTYAAVQAFAQAAETAGSTDLEDLENALRSNEFDTTLGKLTFDEKGDVLGSGYYLYEFSDGTYSMLTE